ncbi:MULTISPECIES: glycosyltransferase family 2 protein [unclassified Providencia]|uniref:glycosyltransferase family 2 protein n=1 Tax=unclassified Providencia TaxID=2633465 RepID=UPI00234AEABD|nr:MULTISPECIES: glycosyltransferase family 2 protein [unclassified Providencia]
MNKEIISIIMPAYNAEKTIKNSIESIVGQSYSDFKIYIINDCSTDRTIDILNEQTDKRIKVINNTTNLGVAKSRNIGINQCQGKYIAFLDSDDLWEPNKLEKQIAILNSGWSVVCSNYVSFDQKNIIKPRLSPEIINYSDMLKSNFIGNLTGIYDQSKIGKVLQKKIGHEDYVMWLSILKITKKAYCVQEPLARYRLSNNSLSGNKLEAMKWQWLIYRNELQFSIPKSIYYFSHYILNALNKRR